MRLKNLILILSIFFISSTSFGLPAVVKLNQDAARGDCLPELGNESPLDILSRNNINVYTGITDEFDATRNKTPLTDVSDPRLINLARVINTIDRIGNSAIRAHRDIDVVFGNEPPYSRQRTTEIHFNPSNQNRAGLGMDDSCGGTSNAALMAHEFGHRIGNSQLLDGSGKTFYTAYNEAVSSTCFLSGYSRPHSERGRNEEFAESFAAFINDPSIFLDKGPRCASAFQFFVRQFGENQINMSCQARRDSIANATPQLPAGIPIFQPSRQLRWGQRLRNAFGIGQTFPSRNLSDPVAPPQTQSEAATVE